MGLRSIPVRDKRGVKHRVRLPGAIANAIAGRDITADQAQSLDRARWRCMLVYQRDSKLYGIGLWILAAAACVMGIATLREHGWSETTKVFWVLCAMGLFCGIALARRYLTRRAVREFDRQTGAVVPMCIACEYPLAGIDAARDGCIVCPECGGAWRVRGLVVTDRA